MLNFDELRQILDMVREHQLTELEIEREGFKIRVKKDGTSQLVNLGAPDSGVALRPPQTTLMATSASPSASPVGSPESPAVGLAQEVDTDEIELAVVKSPIVGTFYRSAEPGAPAFVEVGDMVKKDQVLCIIEAMKLMNEITSEYDGEIVSAYIESGQPVQYGERLFAIRCQ